MSLAECSAHDAPLPTDVAAPIAPVSAVTPLDDALHLLQADPGHSLADPGLSRLTPAALDRLFLAARRQAEQSHDGISDTSEIERLCEALDAGAAALEEVLPRLAPVATAIEDGLLPDDDTVHRGDFVQEWRDHLERRVRRMRLVSATGRRMAADMARLDDDAANEIFRERDDD